MKNETTNDIVANETNNRFADLVVFMDELSDYGVAVHVWKLSDGSVFELREDRGSTETISERVFSRNSEQAACYSHMIAEKRQLAA